jgi:hypothetical protein
VLEGGAKQTAGRWQSLSRFDTAAISIPTGLRCAVAIALPLIVGISTGHPSAVCRRATRYQRLLYNVLGATLAVASLRLWPSPARRSPVRSS